jgi:hypothetical protein
MSFGPWRPGLDDVERRARLREWRAIACLIVGPRHALTIALGDALDDPTAAERARQQLEALPPLPRRRVLATYAALAMPPKLMTAAAG